MATFQMEMRQQQQQQRTNLKQRATATAAAAATSKARQQRQQREEQHSNPPEISTDCTRLWPSRCHSSTPAGGGCNSKISPLTSHSSSIGISSKGNISGTGSNIGFPADRRSCQRGLIMLSMLVVFIALISGNGGK